MIPTDRGIIRCTHIKTVERRTGRQDFSYITGPPVKADMSYGITNLMGYGIHNRNQQSNIAGQNSSVDFMDLVAVKQSENAESNTIDVYKEYLKSKYGCNLTEKNVGKDQKSIDSVGAGTFGAGNVVIASNILEEMARDPEKAAYYEGKIQHYFNSLPRYQAELSAMGHEIHSSGIIIHPDGTVTHYISGDLKPEVRAKIEAQIKAEREAKEKRRQGYLERSQKAAEKRRQELEESYKKQRKMV